MDLDGRSALVTGGAGGLGEATVRRLREVGLGVTVFDRDAARANALAEDLGAGVVAVVGDTNDDDDVAAAIRAADSVGTFSLLVNVAGGGVGGGRTVGRDGTPHDKASFVATMEMNTFGTFNVTRLAAAAMAGNDPDEHGQRGVVVNTASIAGIEGQTGQVAYAAAKAAILGMTLPMARDLAPSGIRVCAIAPGTMGTPAMLGVRDEVKQHLVEQIVFPKRMGRPAEFALLVESIARNPYLNGENIRLDGALRFPPEVTVVSIDSLVGTLALEPIGADRYRAPNAGYGRGVIFGGQLLAQSIVAALEGQEAKTVKTLHTVFARSGSAEAPVEISVEQMHTGRSFASSAVTISQADRLCTRSLALLSAADPDLIRHSDRAPDVPGPDECASFERGSGAWQVRVVGGVDVSDPDLIGPPDLCVWTRFVGAPDDPGVDQALLAFATDGFLVGAAMRPHRGVGQSQAHVTLSTGVVSHTLTFHERFSANDWLLLAHHSTYAGRGRCHGRADVFRRDGALVASFVQDGMIRAMEGVPSERSL